MMEASDEEIEVIVQSVLPSSGPQGKFRIKVPSNCSVEGLMRRLCKEAKVPLLPHYVFKNAKNQVLPSLETLDNVEITHGSVLLWADEDVRTMAVSSYCNVWWFLSLISFLIGAAGLVAICILKTREQDISYSYGVVFDAGSSHTSMYIYKWNGAKINETAVAAQFGDPFSPKNFSGISDFTNDPSQGTTLMEMSLDNAESRIPQSDWKKTPLYLGATAGMRMLDKVNHTVGEEILEVIRKEMSTYPFSYNASNVRIISGEEEGAFSWITSNYISGVFHVRPMTKLLSAKVDTKTKGALDMGGASAQITFIPQGDTQMPDKYKYSVDLFGRHYDLYTHSFLCYGVNEALRRYRAALIQAQNFSSSIDDPCAPANWTITLKSADIFEAPCVSGHHAEQTFGFRIVHDEEDTQVTEFTFHGTSNVSECQSFVPETLFNFSAPCPDPPCSFNGVYQPPVMGDFYAFSTFYYVTNFLNLTDSERDTFNLTDFQDATIDFCSKDWDEVKDMPAGKKSAIPTYCFQSNFVDVVLTRGYGFNESNWDNLHFVEKVADTKVGWSLGFMLSKSNGLPVNVPQTSLSTVTFVLLAVLFAVFILTAIGFACHARLYKVAKRKRKYSRLNEYGSL